MANRSKPAAGEKSAESGQKPSRSRATRETIESVAVAFVLAFLFRTFVAEAFIIPTGSMSPSLMGAHKDVNCSQCGTRFKVNSSTDEQPRQQRASYSTAAGTCPQCRHIMTFDRDVGGLWGDPTASNTDEPTYSGDRIVVSKFQYAIADPERWDVVVFKYPGDAVQNYIKRLVGLPNEIVRILHGDLFIKADGQPSFELARRSPSQVMAMRQFVHDTNHDAAALYEFGFPLRWSGDDDSSWNAKVMVDGKNSKQRYMIDASAPDTQWLRYRHIVASPEVWQKVNEAKLSPEVGEMLTSTGVLADAPPQLVGDFNSYNTRRMKFEFYRNPRRQTDLPKRQESQGSVIGIPPDSAWSSIGDVHWVGDLMVEAECGVESDSGTLWLQLVKAGHEFRCAIDVATGRAELSIVPWQSDEAVASFAPTAETRMKAAGEHKVQFANVDNQLLLWIDGKVVEFDGPTSYDWEELFGPREEIQPQLGDSNTGDMAPAAIGAAGMRLAIDRLAMYRDIYYIATDDGSSSASISDGVSPAVLVDPTRWAEYKRRSSVEFPLGPDQFFVMGDNSPQSKDARIWSDTRRSPSTRPAGWPVDSNGFATGDPGGAFLPRHLLIGRAVFVAWPHPWSTIIPNVGDMRLIR
jgi:signal peptidase I